MRVAVPSCSLGKSGGYRVIYSAAAIDEMTHVVFLATYFKGDFEDLTITQYDDLLAESEQILGDPLSYDWEDFPPPSIKGLKE